MALALRFHSPYLATYSQDPLPLILQAVGYARKSVDICVHHLNLEPLVSQAAAIRDLGVKVRWVVDFEKTDGELEKRAVQLLEKYKFQKGRDWRSFQAGRSLMHHKYVVIDERRVFAGTMSFTGDCFYLQDNVDVMVDSAEVGEAFSRATDVYWEEAAAPITPWRTMIDPVESVTVGPDQTISAYFTPFDGHVVIERMVETIASAERCIEFAFPTVADSRISSALEDAAQRGVAVHGLVDQSMSKPEHWKFTPTLRRQIRERHIRGMGNFLKDTSGKIRDRMHVSLLVVDDRHIFTASVNFAHSERRMESLQTADSGFLIHSIPLARQAQAFIEALRSLAMNGGHTIESYKHQAIYRIEAPATRKPAAKTEARVQKVAKKKKAKVVKLKAVKKKTAAKKVVAKRKSANGKARTARAA